MNQNSKSDNAIVDFADFYNQEKIKFKKKILDKIDNNVTKDVEILVPLKYLSKIKELFKS